MNHERLIRRTFELANMARTVGNHPFGALLADHDGEVVAEAQNSVVTARDATGHAETNLIRMASLRFPSEFLADCTLYTSTEPCVMCAGAIYWSNVRTIAFGLRESELFKLTSQNASHPTLRLRAIEVFARGQHLIEVVGPLLEDEALAVHDGYWR
jgi:tRNA(Arg) A34 adenosine deaminase TadA